MATADATPEAMPQKSASGLNSAPNIGVRVSRKTSPERPEAKVTTTGEMRFEAIAPKKSAKP